MEIQSSPLSSYTVSSPRRTMSLLKRRKKRKNNDSVSAWDEWEQNKDMYKSVGDSGLAGLKTSEVYGFVGAISTVVATGVFLLWAYTPEPWLHWLGITYYPSKYWALAIPTYVMVVLVLGFLLYLGLNFMITPSPTSLSTVFDEYSRDPIQFSAVDEDTERPIEPISDIGIDEVNNLMFGKANDTGA